MSIHAAFLYHYNHLNSEYIFIFTIQITSFKGHFTWSIKNIHLNVHLNGTSTDVSRNDLSTAFILPTEKCYY